MEISSGDTQNAAQHAIWGEDVLALHDPTALVPRHCDYLAARNLRPNSIRQRRNVLLRLLKFHQGVPLTEIDDRHLLAFLMRPSISPRSRAVELSELTPFFHWLVFEGERTDDPTLRIQRPKRVRSLPRPIADGQLELALTRAPVVRIKAALLFAAYAGLRACEIAPLKAEDVRRFDRPATIFIREQKGGDQGSVPLSPILDNALATCDLPTQGWLFPYWDGPRKGEHVTATYMSKLCNDYLRSVEITDTLHSLRHWFGTQTYRASGRDILQTQKLLRHKHVGSTEGYTYVDPGEAAVIVGRLPTF